MGDEVDILLVDDQPNNLLSLEAILSGLGHLVTATSGTEALRHVLSRDFAVILLDVQMPIMDGYETAALIRSRAASRHTPIIFLTASHRAEVQQIRGYDAGGVDYLFKPIDPEILRSKVAVFVEMAKKSELIQRQSKELARREAESRELAAAQARLVVDLEQKNRDLEAVNRELEAFSYSVSHDLRGPLRSIDGFSQAILDDCELDETGRNYLRRVRDATQRMGELIDGLLSLARVTRSELHRQDLDLSKLARDVLARLQAQDPARRVECVIESDLAAEADARLLVIALENLLGNAWKFTAKRQDPRIEVGRVSGRRDAFYIRDNGAGFNMAYAHKLFGAFQRLHSAAEFDGHGIGLATVQRIVRRHGGTIRAESDVGAGATFYFTLDGELS
jgi:two-component system, sensor histidine kinase and response regulator